MKQISAVLFGFGALWAWAMLFATGDPMWLLSGLGCPAMGYILWDAFSSIEEQRRIVEDRRRNIRHDA